MTTPVYEFIASSDGGEGPVALCLRMQESGWELVSSHWNWSVVIYIFRRPRVIPV